MMPEMIFLKLVVYQPKNNGINQNKSYFKLKWEDGQVTRSRRIFLR